MKKLLLLLTLLASTAFAQFDDYVLRKEYSTRLLPDGGSPIWYVDVRGDDVNNTCLNPYTNGGSDGPCATPQAAINKIPKLLRHQATVSIDAGTYPGFIISGFTEDNGIQQTTGGLLIDGALVNSTLATGPPTGTATSGTAGSGSGNTYGTLTDGTQSWTTNDLTGRLITTASPTNTAFVISSNTSTVVTVVGLWAAPTSSTTYTILDPSFIIGTPISRPASPFSASSANFAAILIAGNSIGGRSSSIGLRNFRISTSAGAGIFISDASSGFITQAQIRVTASLPAIDIGASGSLSPGTGLGRWDLTSVDVSVTSGDGIINHRGNSALFRVLVRGGGGTGYNSLSPSALATIIQCDFQNLVSPVFLEFGGSVSIGQDLHLNCTAGSGIGIQLGGALNVPPAQTLPTFLACDTASFSTCGTGLQAVGAGSSVDVAGFTGSVATTGISAYSGSIVTYTKTGMTLTAGTNEINLDNSGKTSTFAGILATQCLATYTYTDGGVGPGSRVCAR